MAKEKTYSEKLKSPKWQKKRLEIMRRDKFACKKCGDTETQLHVHHLEYNNDGEPWEIDNKLLITLCEDCHQIIENLKKEYPDAVFQDIKIYKSDGWTGGSKIMYLAHDNICEMTVFDDNGNWMCGYNISGNTLRQTISILKKALNG